MILERVRRAPSLFLLLTPGMRRTAVSSGMIMLGEEAHNPLSIGDLVQTIL